MTTSHISTCAAVLLAALAWHAQARATDPAPAFRDTMSRPALAIGKVSAAALLSVASAGRRMVAVGERGIIALSDDQGRTWRQAASPVSVSLTGVRFIDAQHGWAVGHRGVVLRTEDGGQHWQRQLDGGMIATAMQRYAQQLEANASSDSQRRTAAAARQMAADGADKPLFDLYFSDLRHGLVVGAYGLALATSDGGQSWQPVMERLPNPRGLHLYAIAGDATALYVAGEQGALLRSSDGGASFAPLAAPYRGSFFALAATRSGAIIAAGMQGHAYRSGDGGRSWQKLGLASAAALTGFARDADGHLLLADQAGRVFLSRDDGASFAEAAHARAPLSAIALGHNGALTGVGLAGAVPIATADQANSWSKQDER